MISTTTYLYAGTEDSLNREFEKEIALSVYFSHLPDTAERDVLTGQFETVAKEEGRQLTEVVQYAEVVVVTHNEENRVEIWDNENPAYDYTEMSMLYAMAKEDYEKQTGQELGEIAHGNVIVAASNEFEWNTIDIFGQEYYVAGLTEGPDTGMGMEDFLGDTGVLYVIVADDGELDKIRGNANVQYHIEAETDGTREEKMAYASALRTALEECRTQPEYDCDSIRLDSRTEQHDSYLETNGGFLFLGFFLGIMFLMITILIIYYKQISEGYEDRERFIIMTKVGMEKREVKSAINTQVQTVFFMPITVAVIHLAAAFPMLRQLMMVFGLSNTTLFIQCLIGTVTVFAAIYFIVFKMTSTGYYKLINQ